MTAAHIHPPKYKPQPLVVGLVNNMSVAAMASTHAQFASLLAATGRPVKLLCFTMRGDQEGLHGHLPIDAMRDHTVDAIIITGMEPSTGDLREEWLWYELTRLHDWCERDSIPSIWSCLAAHVAVLHRDGITRRPLEAKISGVFECIRTSAHHRLTDGMPGRWHFPHSRYNGLPEAALDARGYAVLSRSEAVGVDIFARGDGPATFYFQGHPEYQAGTLLREYLRDLRRYLAGESATCPFVPSDYLDEQTEQVFDALRKQALDGSDVLATALARAVRAKFRRNWSDTAVRLYANWLDMAAEHAARRASSHSPLASGVTVPEGAALS